MLRHAALLITTMNATGDLARMYNQHLHAVAAGPSQVSGIEFRVLDAPRSTSSGTVAASVAAMASAGSVCDSQASCRLSTRGGLASMTRCTGHGRPHPPAATHGPSRLRTMQQSLSEAAYNRCQSQSRLTDSNASGRSSKELYRISTTLTLAAADSEQPTRA